jgi:hypothetical protein
LGAAKATVAMAATAKTTVVVTGKDTLITGMLGVIVAAASMWIAFIAVMGPE